MALDFDSSGNIVTCPVLGWTTAPVAGMAVLLRLEFARNEEQLRTGGEALQAILTPQQALELAETLTTQARRILDTPAPETPPS